MHIFYRSLFWLYYWHSSPSWVSLAAHATIDSRARMVSSTNSSKDRLVVCCVSGKLVLSEMRQAHAHEKPFSSTRVCFEPFVPQHLAATEPVQATKDLSRALGADMASAKTTQVGRLPGPVKMKAPAKATRYHPFLAPRYGWASLHALDDWTSPVLPWIGPASLYAAAASTSTRAHSLEIFI